MEQNYLTYLTAPKVTIATNTFVNVPVILKYDDINLIEIVKEEGLGYTTQIPIFHNDGTYLAKVNGTRMYLTDDGKKAGLKIDKYDMLWVCKMNEQTMFEIQQQPGDTFKTSAELYTPDGYFLKCSDNAMPNLIDINGNAITLNGIAMSGNTIVGCKIGLWVKKNGGFAVGLN
jgi:hypothetical protein